MSVTVRVPTTLRTLTGGAVRGRRRRRHRRRRPRRPRGGPSRASPSASSTTTAGCAASSTCSWPTTTSASWRPGHPGARRRDRVDHPGRRRRLIDAAAAALGPFGSSCSTPRAAASITCACTRPTCWSSTTIRTSAPCSASRSAARVQRRASRRNGVDAIEQLAHPTPRRDAPRRHDAGYRRLRRPRGAPRARPGPHTQVVMLTCKTDERRPGRSWALGADATSPSRPTRADRRDAPGHLARLPAPVDHVADRPATESTGRRPGDD